MLTMSFLSAGVFKRFITMFSVRAALPSPQLPKTSLLIVCNYSNIAYNKSFAIPVPWVAVVSSCDHIAVW